MSLSHLHLMYSCPFNIHALLTPLTFLQYVTGSFLIILSLLGVINKPLITLHFLYCEDKTITTFPHLNFPIFPSLFPNEDLELTEILSSSSYNPKTVLGLVGRE